MNPQKQKRKAEERVRVTAEGVVREILSVRGTWLAVSGGPHRKHEKECTALRSKN